MKTAELRRRFIEYFVERGHQAVESSPVVPGDDPTLLFTNAGMNQFKGVFTGEESVDYQRAVSCQRCIRAGGKHNDLDNVGRTARHHTFFEMLGNFSFGAYFKREAIQLAWTFLTEILALPVERLWVTVYHEDQESEAIWLNEIGVSPERLRRCGREDNFWSMGPVGPCGPCSEIFYDHGPGVAGGPPGSEEADGDRYVEIWNLVFMEFNATADGQMLPLPNPCVDTGMGLERIAAVMQGVHDNYDIDDFQTLQQALIQRVCAEAAARESVALRVIADHIRAIAMMILDGVVPGNEGRAYVLRRIIRRAARFGQKLGLEAPFLSELVPTLVAIMAEAYPALRTREQRIMAVLSREEEQFSQTLASGLKRFQELVQVGNGHLPGDQVFMLYDTYGFPWDLSEDLAHEQGLSIDRPGFERAMEMQRAASRQNSQFASTTDTVCLTNYASVFLGYQQLEATAVVQCIGRDNAELATLAVGQRAYVVLDQTPFYAECGGQVGDQGTLSSDSVVFHVLDTQRSASTIVHFGEVISGCLRVHDRVHAVVDARRHDIARNHSATHLLHHVLREQLGTEVEQRGSLVDADRLRFDFSYHQPLSADQLQAIERSVNAAILANVTATKQEMTIEQARAQGALAMFNERYAARVNVVTFGQCSSEVCGGTHVHATGDIGFFKLISESGVASGIRRIEAMTGQAAIHWVQAMDRELQQLSVQLQAPRTALLEKVTAVQKKAEEYRRQCEMYQSQDLMARAKQITATAVKAQGVQVVCSVVQLPTMDEVKQLSDYCRSLLNDYVIVLLNHSDERVQYLASVSPSAQSQVAANQVVRTLAQQLNGKGGGRADSAQGGAAALPMKALQQSASQLLEWVVQQC